MFKLLKISLSSLVLILISTQIYAQTFDKKQTALIAMQKSYFDAVIKKDYGYLDDLLAEDYIGGYALGSIDKQRESKDLREFPLKDFQMTDIKTSFPNSKTEIIVFKLHVTVTVGGKDFTEDRYFKLRLDKTRQKMAFVGAERG